MPNLITPSYIAGWLPTSNTYNSNLIDAVDERVAYSFIPSISDTITDIFTYVTAKSGTLGANDCVLELANNSSSGFPNLSSLLGTYSTLAAPIAATTMIQFTNINAAVSAYSRYWCSFKNANASPGTNDFRLGQADGQTYFAGGGDNQCGFAMTNSINAGSTWLTGSGGALPALIIKYQSGVYEGFGMTGIAQNSTDAVYSQRELGNAFVWTDDMAANVRQVSFRFFLSGSPTGSARARIYHNPTTSPVLLATSVTQYPLAHVSTSVTDPYMPFWFSSTVAFEPGEEYGVVLSETTQSDTSSHHFRMHEYIIHSGTPAQSCKPFNGTMKEIYTTNGGSSFSVNNNSIYPMGLIMDEDTPFSNPGTGLLPIGNGLGGLC
jgi:hypothetical protein